MRSCPAMHEMREVCYPNRFVRYFSAPSPFQLSLPPPFSSPPRPLAPRARTMASPTLYDTLKVSRQASEGEIRAAYSALALSSHPEKHSGEDKAEAEAAFRAAAEAYFTLGDARRRAVYDESGEAGAGASDRDPLDTFAAFFGSPNPFAQKFASGGLFAKGGKAAPSAPQRGEGGAVRVPCTLEELYRGCQKRVVLPGGKDGKTLAIQAGWKSGTTITYPGEGEAGADLVFVLAEAPHASFRRSGRNLVYTAQISLADALAGSVVEVRTLDGRVLPVGVHDIVRPGYTKRVPGEGFPSAKKKGKRGDLVIEFKVRYPAKLSERQRQDLRKVLPA